MSPGKNGLPPKFVYIKGDEFINEFIELVRAGRGGEFRSKYREADLLLVDDVQFVAGKEQVQNEFFHTFNNLYETGRQIVLTSDRPPSEMTLLDDRLRTRFEWGLLADIAPPEFETRVAIVKNKAAILGMELPDNVRLIRDYDPSLPELAHDPDQIEQVLLNIVRNALQALGPEGGEIILRTRTAFQLTLHGERYRLAARIDVEDNGPGIPPHLQDTLFYPMVSGREGGTGLGLSIARNLIDQHSGKIEFTSWPGHTEFSVYLPIRK